VRGRALIHLDRARDALKVLRRIDTESPLGWLVPAATADAYVELDDGARAASESERALALADGAPQARYHAARTMWHADRVWDALDHISIYRAAQPDNTDGLILHGSILGYIASRGDNRGAYEAALALFERALPSQECEATRLYAVTAARLGRWRDAFKMAQRLRRRSSWESGRCDHGDPAADHGHIVDRHILPDAFEALGESDPSELGRATDEAERVFGPSPVVTAQRALARGLQGDVAGALDAVGRTRETLAEAPTADQIAIAAALYVRRDFAGAYDILGRLESDLARPEGLLRLAESATAIGELDRARSLLEDLAREDDVAGEVARVATAVMRAERAAARKAQVDVVAEVRWQPVTAQPESRAPRESLWEGSHHRTTPMLDPLPNRDRLN
jgi:tetratricopeptide (TPR) repeat protein